MTLSLGTIETRLRVDTGGFQRKMRVARSTMGNVAGMAGRLATALGTVSAVAAGASVRAFGNFEESLIRAGTKIRATEEQLDSLRQAAISAGEQSAFSAKEAADGLALLGQAGFEASEQTDALPGVLKLAEATALNVAEAADKTSGVLRGFALDVNQLNRVNDALVATSQETNTNVSQLGEAMSFAAPAAKSLGISVEETAAFIGSLADAGIRGGRAGRQLRNIMTEMSSAAEELGVNMNTADIRQQGLVASIRELEEEGLNASSAMDLFGKRAGNALQAVLVRGIKNVDKTKVKLKELRGVTEDTAEEMRKGLNKQLEILTGSIATLGVEIGKQIAPSRKFTSELTNLVNQIRKGDKPITDTTFSIMALAGGFIEATAKGETFTSKLAEMVEAMKKFRSQAEKTKDAKDILLGLTRTGQVPGDIEDRLIERIKESRTHTFQSKPVTKKEFKEFVKNTDKFNEKTVEKLKKIREENEKQRRLQEARERGTGGMSSLAGRGGMTNFDPANMSRLQEEITFGTDKKKTPDGGVDDDKPSGPTKEERKEAVEDGAKEGVVKGVKAATEGAAGFIRRGGKKEAAPIEKALKEQAKDKAEGIGGRVKGVSEKLAGTQEKLRRQKEKEKVTVKDTVDSISSLSSVTEQLAVQFGTLSGSEGLKKTGGAIGAVGQGISTGARVAGALGQIGAGAATGGFVGAGVGALTAGAGLIQAFASDSQKKNNIQKRRKLFQKQRQKQREFRRKLAEDLARATAEEFERRELAPRVFNIDAKGSLVGTKQEVSRNLAEGLREELQRRGAGIGGF